ncbi:MAG: hypothetical protein K8R67_03980 [Desulfobacteraceae bacterium]|nr:hypothetical protein [Desulfobacteraceae bacterium]
MMNLQKVTLQTFDIKEGKLSSKDRNLLRDDIFQGFINSKNKKKTSEILKLFRQESTRIKSLFNKISKCFYTKIQINEDQINSIYKRQRQEFKNLAQELKRLNRNI